MTIGFNASEYCVEEGDDVPVGNSVLVCLELTGVLDRDVVVTMAASDGIAVGELILTTLPA